MRGLHPGQVIEAAYPFVLTTYEKHNPDFDGLGGHWCVGWKPGCEIEYVGGYSDQMEFFCHAQGKVIFSVVSLHKPSAKYGEKVFFTRQWRDPDGRLFGKTHLRMMGRQAFERRCLGWVIDNYDVIGGVEDTRSVLQREVDAKNKKESLAA